MEINIFLFIKAKENKINNKELIKYLKSATFINKTS